MKKANPVTPELLPPGRFTSGYRLMLWAMPTCIVAVTTYGLLLLALGHRFQSIAWGWEAAWLLINLGSTMGIGIFDAHLRRQESNGPVRPLLHALGFLIYQVLIVPVCLVLLIVVAGILTR